MRPYGTFDTKTGQPEQSPDVADLIRDGRPSRCGHIARTSRARRATRRALNRASRILARAAIKAEGDRQ
jgi:hypothetical protein